MSSSEDENMDFEIVLATEQLPTSTAYGVNDTLNVSDIIPVSSSPLPLSETEEPAFTFSYEPEALGTGSDSDDKPYTGENTPTQQHSPSAHRQRQQQEEDSSSLDSTLNITLPRASIRQQQQDARERTLDYTSLFTRQVSLNDCKLTTTTTGPECKQEQQQQQTDSSDSAQFDRYLALPRTSSQQGTDTEGTETSLSPMYFEQHPNWTIHASDSRVFSEDVKALCSSTTAAPTVHTTDTEVSSDMEDELPDFPDTPALFRQTGFYRTQSSRQFNEADEPHQHQTHVTNSTMSFSATRQRTNTR